MHSSDDKQAREEETIGETASGSYASRKGRLTPRQMWARQARRRAKSQTKTADADPSEEAVHAETVLGEDAESPTAAFLGEEPQDNEDLQDDDETIIEVIQEDSDDESPDDAEILEVIEDDSDEELPAEEKPEPVMVDASMQPGAMNYPYATHRLAPDEPDTEKAPSGFERRISSGFVIGVVVVAFALILGMSIVGQRRRIVVLEERVRVLEDAAPAHATTLVMGH